MWNYAALGLSMGIGYLAKAAFLPMAAVLLFLVATSIRRNAGGALRLAVAAAVFLSIAAPYIGLMSHVKGRFTTGTAAS